MIVLDALGHALSLAAAMSWEILWALILGFAISGAVQAVVSKAEMGRLLPDDSPRSLTIACGLGAASSSCSYAAVAMARSVFRKGADFTSAMAFQFASTNLVVELGIILAVLLGWQFTAAEFVGGPLMIVLLALLFRALLRPQMVREAREQADRGLVGVMEGHAAMDMSVTGGSLWSRIRSPKGFAAISHYFVMDWVSVGKDIAAGRPAGRDAVVCLLDRERAVGGGAVERRDQLRWRDRVHLRRPDRAADPQHLPQVLRPPDEPVPAGHLLPDHGGRGPGGGPGLRGARPGPADPQRQGGGGQLHAQLHHRAEPAVPAPGGGPGGALPAHQGPGDAAHDERPLHSRVTAQARPELANALPAGGQTVPTISAICSAIRKWPTPGTTVVSQTGNRRGRSNHTRAGTSSSCSPSHKRTGLPTCSGANPTAAASGVRRPRRRGCPRQPGRRRTGRPTPAS